MNTLSLGVKICWTPSRSLRIAQSLKEMPRQIPQPISVEFKVINEIAPSQHLQQSAQSVDQDTTMLVDAASKGNLTHEWMSAITGDTAHRGRHEHTLVQSPTGFGSEGRITGFASGISPNACRTNMAAILLCSAMQLMHRSPIWWNGQPHPDSPTTSILPLRKYR